ncbi:MAG: hypothetical protein Q4G08_07150, partial [Capnocytophaga sp.]|nr:hypothetical protein [Capnocytophaga sp.]
ALLVADSKGLAPVGGDKPTAGEVVLKQPNTPAPETNFQLQKGLDGQIRVERGGDMLLPQFTRSTIDDAVLLTMKQEELHIFANKLHPKPWLNIRGYIKIINSIFIPKS